MASDFQAELKELGLPAAKVTIRLKDQTKIAVGHTPGQAEVPEAKVVTVEGKKFLLTAERVK